MWYLTPGPEGLWLGTSLAPTHRFPMPRSAPLLTVLVWSVVAPCGAARAQDEPPPRSEEVRYHNVADSTPLRATLTLPAGPGPHPGVVLLSIAGTAGVVDALVEEGYAVLAPVRRGFVDVEPLLRADYADLAGDVRAAADHLSARDEVDGGRVAVVAQADDTPPALLAVASSARPRPLLLLAPPAFAGDEEFRRSQLWLARRAGAGEEELEMLRGYIAGIVEVALTDAPPYVREDRLEGLRSVSPVQLPRNAAFPADERQAHFFASRLWHDRLAFQPEVAFSRMDGPVLVLIGEEDPNIPLDDYVASVRRGLAASASEDARVCVLPGRARHTFTEEGIAVLASWLDAHLRMGSPVSRWAPSGPCAR